MAMVDMAATASATATKRNGREQDAQASAGCSDAAGTRSFQMTFARRSAEYKEDVIVAASFMVRPQPLVLLLARFLALQPFALLTLQTLLLTS